MLAQKSTDTPGATPILSPAVQSTSLNPGRHIALNSAIDRGLLQDKMWWGLTVDSEILYKLTMIPIEPISTINKWKQTRP